MTGDAEGAIAEYRTAAERTNSLPEQQYLTKQAARLHSSRHDRAPGADAQS